MRTLKSRLPPIGQVADVMGDTNRRDLLVVFDAFLEDPGRSSTWLDRRWIQRRRIHVDTSNVRIPLNKHLSTVELRTENIVTATDTQVEESYENPSLESLKSIPSEPQCHHPGPGTNVIDKAM